MVFLWRITCVVVTSLRWWDQLEIHHVLGMSDFGPRRPLWFTSGAECWSVSLIPAFVISDYITTETMILVCKPCIYQHVSYPLCLWRSIYTQHWKGETSYLGGIKLWETKLQLQAHSSLSELTQLCQRGSTDSLRSHKAQPNYTQHCQLY